MSNASMSGGNPGRQNGSSNAGGSAGAKLKLRLEIDTAILSNRPSDNLCIARKVNDTFNVVLLGASINPTGLQTPLQVHNTFTWENTFRAFYAKDLVPMVVVSKSSNAIDVEFGQQVPYDSQLGQLTKAIHADANMFSNGDQGESSAEDSFILARVPSRWRGGCECKVAIDDNLDMWYPIYVDPGRHPTTTDVQITPSNEYLIFWDSLLTPNAAFRHYPRSEKKIFSFQDGATEISLRFGWKVRNKPGPGEEAGFYTT